MAAFTGGGGAIRRLRTPGRPPGCPLACGPRRPNRSPLGPSPHESVPLGQEPGGRVSRAGDRARGTIALGFPLLALRLQLQSPVLFRHGLVSVLSSLGDAKARVG